VFQVKFLILYFTDLKRSQLFEGFDFSLEATLTPGFFAAVRFSFEFPTAASKGFEAADFCSVAFSTISTDAGDDSSLAATQIRRGHYLGIATPPEFILGFLVLFFLLVLAPSCSLTEFVPFVLSAG